MGLLVLGFSTALVACGSKDGGDAATGSTAMAAAELNIDVPSVARDADLKWLAQQSVDSLVDDSMADLQNEITTIQTSPYQRAAALVPSIAAFAPLATATNLSCVQTAGPNQPLKFPINASATFACPDIMGTVSLSATYAGGASLNLSRVGKLGIVEGSSQASLDHEYSYVIPLSGDSFVGTRHVDDDIQVASDSYGITEQSSFGVAVDNSVTLAGKLVFTKNGTTIGGYKLSAGSGLRWATCGFDQGSITMEGQGATVVIQFSSDCSWTATKNGAALTAGE